MALGDLHKLYRNNYKAYLQTIRLRTEKVIEQKILANPVYQFDKGELFQSIELILQSKHINDVHIIVKLTDAQWDELLTKENLLSGVLSVNFALISDKLLCMPAEKKNEAVRNEEKVETRRKFIQEELYPLIPQITLFESLQSKIDLVTQFADKLASEDVEALKDQEILGIVTILVNLLKLARFYITNTYMWGVGDDSAMSNRCYHATSWGNAAHSIWSGKTLVDVQLEGLIRTTKELVQLRDAIIQDDFGVEPISLAL